MKNIANASCSRSRRLICFDCGHWWYHDPEHEARVRICGLLRDSGWRVSEIVDHLGISRRTFERAVSESLGIPAKLWLRQLRAVCALHRLRENCQIKEVSFELGFRHATDFASEFKLMVGVTPSQYQEAERTRLSDLGFKRE